MAKGTSGFKRFLNVIFNIFWAIFGGLYMIGKVIPFLCKLPFVGIFLFFKNWALFH